MPMKPKFTKNEVVDVALEIVRKYGISKLTARDLARELGSSACPIFTLFKNMEEVISLTKEKTISMFHDYVSEGFSNAYPYREIGIRIVTFATEYPKLFHFINFAKGEAVNNLDIAINGIGFFRDECLEIITKDYKLPLNKASLLFEQIWIYTYGLSVLCAQGKCRFSYDELSELLGRQFFSVYYAIKNDVFNKNPI